MSFVKLLQQNVNNPSFEGIILNKNELEILLHSKRLFSFLKKENEGA